MSRPVAPSGSRFSQAGGTASLSGRCWGGVPSWDSPAPRKVLLIRISVNSLVYCPRSVQRQLDLTCPSAPHPSKPEQSRAHRARGGLAGIDRALHASIGASTSTGDDDCLLTAYVPGWQLPRARIHPGKTGQPSQQPRPPVPSHRSESPDKTSLAQVSRLGLI